MGSRHGIGSTEAECFSKEKRKKERERDIRKLKMGAIQKV